MPFRNDRKGSNHQHDFQPIRRVRHILTEKCVKCPKVKTKILGDSSKERVDALDKEIAENKKKGLV